MDPLSALRDFTMRDEVDKIVQVGDEFRFGNDYSFPCGVATAYKSKQGSSYTLETLVHFVKNHHLKYTDYMQYARIHNFPSISFVDRKPLLDYLQGKVSSSDAIQFVAPQNPKFSSDHYLQEEPGLISETQYDNESGHNGHAGVRDSENYMMMLKAIERPLKDRETVLESPKRNFLTALQKEEERLRLEAQQRKDGLVVAKSSRLMRGDERGFGDDYGYEATPKPKIMIKGSKIGEGVPIILVPSASQTLITIYNVKEFLEDGVYIPTDAKVKMMKGPKPDCVTVQKKFSRDKIVTAYEVRDKPTALKAEDWDRVVAVFVLGKEWQFKDWPFKDHVEVFNKILGFYMRFEDDSVESAKTVKQWNVKIISISKNKRHQDRAAALEVWDRLEEFVRSRSRG